MIAGGVTESDSGMARFEPSSVEALKPFECGFVTRSLRCRVGFVRQQDRQRSTYDAVGAAVRTALQRRGSTN